MPRYPVDDIILGKAFDRRLMGRLLGYALPYKARLAQVILLVLVVTGLGVAGPIIAMMVIDGPLEAHIRGDGGESSTALAELAKLSALYVVIALALMISRYMQNLAMAMLGQKITLDLRLKTFEHRQRMPHAYYDRNPVSRLVTRNTSDI